MLPLHASSVPRSDDLAFEVIERADACVVSIAGEVDLASAPWLKTELSRLSEQAGARDIVLELARLEHLDSTGLAVLIGFRRRLSPAQRLVVADPSPMVRRILGLTGLLSAFDTFTSVEDALAYLAQTDAPDAQLPLSPDAALILGLAQTALPFADSYAAEARCWRRILLPQAWDEDPQEPAPDAAPDGGSGGHAQRLDRVLAHAGRLARERQAPAIRTGDLLRAVTSIYGSLFDSDGPESAI